MEACGAMMKEKEETLWITKAKTGTELFEQTGNIHDIKLSCDCPCSSCKDIYISYLEEKAMTGLLNDTLEMERKEFEVFVERIKELEQQRAADVQQKLDIIAVERLKCSELNEQLQYERQLRLQETYNSESDKQRIMRLEAEINRLQRSVVEQSEDQAALAVKANAQAEMLKRVNAVNESLAGRLRVYEQQINDIEVANTQLRLKLNRLVTFPEAASDQGRSKGIGNSVDFVGKADRNNKALRPILRRDKKRCLVLKPL